MRTKLTTKIWLGLGGLAVGVLIGAVIVWVRTLYGPVGEQSVEAARRAYQEGEKALQAGQTEIAVQKCDQANQLAGKALAELKDRAASARSEVEQVRLLQLEGEACWVKARALRDRFHAEKAVAGEKVETILDTSTGERFRSPLQITDTEQRTEAVICQRLAAQRLSNRPEILLANMRTELILTTIDWSFVEGLARATLVLDPKDARSLYLLARIDVEQRRNDGKGPALPSPEDKRSRERLLKAREHLAAPGAEKIPPFRKLYLEAQIARSLRDQYSKGHKTKESDREDQTLAEILLTAKPDSAAAMSPFARALAANPEGKDLSQWDLESVLGLYTMSIERMLQDVTRDGIDLAPVLQTLAHFTTYATGVADRQEGNIVTDAVLQVATAMGRLQTYAEKQPNAEWAEQLKALQALAGKAREKKATSVALCNALVQVFEREADMAKTRGNDSQAATCRSQAQLWHAASLKGNGEGR